jgi:hypothetical protein
MPDGDEIDDIEEACVEISTDHKRKR